MRDPKYAKPFPDWKSALASLSLIFIAIVALTFSLGSLKDKMSSEVFSITSMYLTFTLIALSLSISTSMMGVNYSRHIITFLFFSLAIFSIFGHIYYYKDIEKINIILGISSTILCLVAINLVNSKIYKKFISYRKMHFKSGRDYVRTLKRNKH